MASSNLSTYLGVCPGDRVVVTPEYDPFSRGDRGPFIVERIVATHRTYQQVTESGVAALEVQWLFVGGETASGYDIVRKIPKE